MDSVIGHERNQSLHDVHPVTAPQRRSQTVNGATVQAPTSTDSIRPPMRGNPWASADPVPIQAVILAAGWGSRLASAIHNRPKCLSDVGGRALIYHQLSLLTETGIRHICVITSYPGR